MEAVIADLQAKQVKPVVSLHGRSSDGSESAVGCSWCVLLSQSWC